MRKLLFTFIVLLNFNTFAQDLKLHGSYRFTRNELGKIAKQVDTTSINRGSSIKDTIKMTKLAAKNDSTSAAKMFSAKDTLPQYVDVYANYKITFMGYDTTNKTNLVYYWYWGVDTLGHEDYIKKSNSNSSKKISKKRSEISSAKRYNGKIFSMPYTKFIDITCPVYRRYKGCQVGAYTVPFRLRGIGGIGGKFEFESSLSLQSNVVFGFGTYKSPESWFDLSGGIGLTGVSLNSKNSSVEKERTATAFTTSIGAVLKFNRWANMGLFVGCDWLGAKDREISWHYNGDLWIGLGINISFNSIKTEDNTFSERKKNEFNSQ